MYYIYTSQVRFVFALLLVPCNPVLPATETTALWLLLGEAKATGVHPDRKTGVKPRRRLVNESETFRQLLQLRCYRPYWLAHSVGPYQQRREGDSGDWALQNLHIFRPGLHLERSLQFP